MIRNYLRIAFRNLWKNKGFSMLNIVGLGAGLAVCLLIMLYVVDERQYDRYNLKADRIYLLEADLHFNGTQFSSTSSPKPMGPTLLKDCPQVEQFVRLNNQDAITVKKGDKAVQDKGAVFADSTLFKVFTLPMLQGDPATALNEPHSIVIDQATARKYFDTENALGKTLVIDNNVPCKVTGVIRDIPAQSHFHFHFIRPLRDGYMENEFNWLSNNVHTYLLVEPGITQVFVQQRLNVAVNTYVGRQLQEMMHSSLADLEKQGNHFRYNMMPLPDIHLKSTIGDGFEHNGSIVYVYIFSIIAAFILIIACVNFMNLSTARSANRAKEVGIRKVAGSPRSYLIFQFLAESILISLCGLLLAILLAFLLMPLFNQFSGKTMEAGSLFTGKMILFLLLLVIVVGCLAGSYPAFYLSSFNPIDVLKGKIARGFKSSWLRSSLVVFQFSISIVLLIGTIVIYNQLKYIREKEIGYNRSQILTLHNTWPLEKNLPALRESLLKIPGIEMATLTDNLPNSSDYNQNGWFRDANFDASRATILTEITVDENYIPTLGMKMADGRNFSKNFQTDSTAIILNQAAVALLGFKEPMRETLYRPENDKPVPYHIVGVVKDFNFQSLHTNVGPMVIRNGYNRGGLSLRLQPGNWQSKIAGIQKEYEKVAGGQPFNYSFMDNDFNRLYKTEEQTGSLFIAFALFAIFIACVGLFGLAAFAAEQRTKEIGVRRVLGAKVFGIVSMLSKDFTRLVIIAAVIAFPLAWWGMHSWLQSFAYRTPIGWTVFLAAGLIALFIALATVSFQSIRAAIANPVKSLRSE